MRQRLRYVLYLRRMFKNMENTEMTELKLSEIKKLLPYKKNTAEKLPRHIRIRNLGYNNALKEFGTKNLLDYVEAVVCPKCRADEYFINTCDKCDSTGAVIRVKEGK